MSLPAKLCLLRLVARRTQGEAEYRAASGPLVHPNLAAVGFYDGAADRESQSHALLLRGDEGLEQVRPDLGRKAGTRIGNADLHNVARKLRLDREVPLAARVHQYLEGVADQVHKDLLDLDAIDQDMLGARIEPKRDRDRILPRTDQRQGAGVLDQLGQMLSLPLAIAPGH